MKARNRPLKKGTPQDPPLLATKPVHEADCNGDIHILLICCAIGS